MNISVTQKNGQLVVNASVNSNTDQKDSVYTRHVLDYLNKNGYKPGKCLKEDRACNRNNKMSGQWIFELDKPSKSVVSSNRAKRTKKSSA